MIEGYRTDIGTVAASVDSTVILSCRSPSTTTASRVSHAEWDFHPEHSGTPVVIHDGSRINPDYQHDDKYEFLGNRTSAIFDLRVNKLQQTDVGLYQCYLVTDNATLKFVYRLQVIGTCLLHFGREISADSANAVRKYSSQLLASYVRPINEYILQLFVWIVL